MTPATIGLAMCSRELVVALATAVPTMTWLT